MKTKRVISHSVDMKTFQQHTRPLDVKFPDDESSIKGKSIITKAGNTVGVFYCKETDEIIIEFVRHFIDGGTMRSGISIGSAACIDMIVLASEVLKANKKI